MDIKKKAIELKDNIKNKTKVTIEWCKKNPEIALAIGSGILAGGKFIIKSGIKYHQNRQLYELKNNYIYDRSHGHYWELRREPSSREFMEIDRRKDDGEKLVDILDDLRLIK